MWTNGIWEGMVTFFIIAIGVAIGFGVFLGWAIPQFWEWVKPFIHAATA